MTSKHQAIKLRREAGTIRQALKKEMNRYSPFRTRYQRLAIILDKAERRYQRRLAAEAEFDGKGEVE